MKFYIEINTGDMYWDNEPDTEIFEGSYEELKDYMDLTNEQLEGLKEYDEVEDEDGEDFRITKM